MNIKSTVIEIISDQLGLEKSDITPEKTLYDLGMDSLDLVELTMAFEEEFDIEISDDDAEKCKTVAEITEYVRCRVN